MKTLYDWFYKPLIRVAASVHGVLFFIALMLATLLRFRKLDEFATTFNHGLSRVSNDIQAEIERKARRKEEKMFSKTNVAVKVAEVHFVDVTSFMCQQDCTQEERWALQQLMETGDIGAAHGAGLDVKFHHNTAFIARTRDLPVVYAGRLIPS